MVEDNGEEGQPEVLRVDFASTDVPVEGCEILPYVVVRMPNGDVTSADSLEAKTGGRVSLQYQWYRCSQRYMCSNAGCKRSAKVQFTSVFKRADEEHPINRELLKGTFLCSKRCLMASWARLRKIQRDEFLRRPMRRTHALHEPAAADQDDSITLTALGPNNPLPDPETNPIEQIEVGRFQKYIPTRDEIGHALRVTCRYVHQLPSGEVRIGPAHVADSRPVLASPPPPPERQLVSLYTNAVYPTRPRWSPRVFRVLTYNCLAEIYASQQQYPKCPAWALAWTYRRHNLIREIESYDADILCLQEVQEDHFEEHLNPHMLRAGFVGVFKSKTREAMGKRGKVDGCATFWHRERFSLREQLEVEFDALTLGRGVKDARALKALMKGNIGQITVLEEFDGSGCTVVVNTHIFWDPDKSEVKVFQVDALLTEIEAVLLRLGGAKASVIFAGDFNSHPDSAVYELVSTGGISVGVHNELAEDHHNILEYCRLSHSMQLRSSYADDRGYEPAYTNYTEHFVGTLDYIWYSEDSLVCVAVMEVPEEKELTIDGAKGLPSTRWSSDHVALMAEFQRV